MSLTTQEFLAAMEDALEFAKDRRIDLRLTDHIVDDLDIDSLAAVEILVSLEDRFGVELIDDPRVLEIETVDGLYRHVSALRN